MIEILFVCLFVEFCLCGVQMANHECWKVSEHVCPGVVSPSIVSKLSKQIWLFVVSLDIWVFVVVVVLFVFHDTVVL